MSCASAGWQPALPGVVADFYDTLWQPALPLVVAASGDTLGAPSPLATTTTMISEILRPHGARSIYRGREGRPFHWLEAGNASGPPLVLVHGFMAQSMAFRRVVEPLGKRFRLIIPDLPAHGRDVSYRHPSVRPTIESLEAWMRAFRDEVLPDERADWVGHSLGATLAYRIARSEPDRIESLALVSPGLRIPGSPLVSFALDHLPARVATLGMNRLGMSLYQALNWRGEPMTPAEAEAYLRPMRSPTRMAFILRLGARLLDGAHSELGPAGVPTMLLWGEQDHILPLEDAGWMGDRLGAEVHVVDDSGHSPMEDTPGAFTRHLLDFLERERC